MPRSSESVAALASALAKAQAELVNPEKSLVATIRSGRPGESERSFRYAPLASGLDIVRKTLGQHEIATVQTTAIDQATGMVTLTTTLAHCSGEWIASDWPVCPVSETANPQRMGAALTYARRYALFTLVGIAGEDDLDAPDLGDAPRSPPRSPPPAMPRGRGNGHAHGTRREPRATLAPEQSAAARDRLVTELGNIASADLATEWARAALPEKNSLTRADAEFLEKAFEQKLAKFASAVEPGEPIDNSAEGQTVIASVDTTTDPPVGIDKSKLTIAEPRRYRNREHLRYVARQACLLCGRKPSDAHHLRYAQPRALARKSSDEFAVPLCRVHHRAVHRTGNERAWWTAAGIDPLKVARKLWKHTRVSEGRIPPDPTVQPSASGSTIQE